MRSRIIDGTAVAHQVRDEVAARVAELKTKGITPGLAVVIVGENPASQVYVRNKMKTAQAKILHHRKCRPPRRILHHCPRRLP